MKIQIITPVFVEFIPEQIQTGKLYISEQYETAIHKCCCGCGEEVVTPLRASGWRLVKRGQSVSLNPSIGNWKYPCQSHYFIQDNQIVWSSKMSPQQIARVEMRDQADTQRYVAQRNALREQETQRAQQQTVSKQPSMAEPRSLLAAVRALWQLVKSFFGRS